jgi:hypothetical protein
VGDRVLQGAVDLVDLGEGLAVVEVEIVGVDQVEPLGLLVSQRFEATMRIRRIRPRVCWKPGFSLKRA